MTSFSSSVIDSIGQYQIRKISQGVSQNKSGEAAEFRVTINGNDDSEEMSLSDYILGALLFPFLISGCTSSSNTKAVVKETQDLSASEKKALDHLLMGIYEANLTLYKKIPNPFYGVETSIDIRTGKPLSKPLSTIAAIQSDYSFKLDDKTARRIEDCVEGTSISWKENGQEKKLKIKKWDMQVIIGFQPETQSSDTISLPFPHMLVIYPYTVEIIQK